MIQGTPLFRAVLRSVLAGLLLALACAIALGWWYVLKPLATRSAEDFAALLIHVSADHGDADDAAREAFDERLRVTHQLDFAAVATPLAAETHSHPYLNLLREALVRRTGDPAAVRIGEEPALRFHAEIRTPAGWLRYSFDKQRITPRPRRALIGAGAALLLASLLTAALLARHLSRPVVRLAAMARAIGAGQSGLPVPISGVREIDALARAMDGLSERLLEQREAQMTLMAGISHDLRSPLARLSMTVGMLGPDINEHTRLRLQADIDEMTRLIEAQMSLTRAQQGEAPRELALCELLAELVDAAEAQRPGCVRLELRTGRCHVQLPETALRRVIGNLLDNAVIHGSDEVTLVLRRLRGGYCIGVRDRGAGIPGAHREAVFRPFRRLDPARQRSTGGSGLGLAIARQLAQTHGWKLGYRPRSGGGSAFWLLLPA
jgi:two-component system, OmpR family, osmolarity sensor histidine kinase EnvZ